MCLKITSALCLATLALAVFGCSSYQPVLYPNAHYRKVGGKQAKMDVAKVIKEAENMDLDCNSHDNKQLSKTVARTATQTGTSIGVSAATGGVGVGAAVGAVGAGASGAIDWLFGSRKPDPIFKKYVETRLREQGYQIIGWK